MAGKFEIFTGNNNEFYFRLKAGNGEQILASEGYKSKPSCKNGIASVQKNCGDENCFEVREAKNGKHYFVLKSTNKQEIGRSQMYASAATCRKGMDSVRRNGKAERIDDLTKE